MKKLTLALVILALAGCSTGPILTSRPSESGAIPRPSAASDHSSGSVAASPLPKAEFVGQIRSKTSVEPCQTLIVDTDGHRWDVWLPTGYRTAFDGDDELIYGPDGAVVARSGQMLGVDVDESANVGSFCMAGRPVKATKVVFVTDATGAAATWASASRPGPTFEASLRGPPVALAIASEKVRKQPTEWTSEAVRPRANGSMVATQNGNF